MSNAIKINPPVLARLDTLANTYYSQGASAKDAFAALAGLRSSIESAILHAKVKIQDELREHRSEGASAEELAALYDALNDAFIGTALEAVRSGVRAAPRLFNEVA